jgi:peroxiredoxin-like protein
VFRFRNNTTWKSGRTGVISADGKPELAVASPAEFGGRPEYWSPEDLFAATVNVCLMQTFMAYAARSNINVVSYESEVEGVLERAEGRYRFTEFTVRPVLVLQTAADLERARTLLESAESSCLISESVRANVRLIPAFRVAQMGQRTVA